MSKPTNSKFSPRHLSRSLVVQGLYAFQTNEASVGEIEDFLQNLNEDDDLELFGKANYELLHSLLFATTENFAKLLEMYQEFQTRELEEVLLAERAILVIAAYELTACLNVPAQVVINEAVELAKEYGATDDSYKFINGLVDKLARKLRASEMLK